MPLLPPIRCTPSVRVPPAVPLGRGRATPGRPQLFPRYRLVGFSGGPGTAAFGRLGVGDLDDRAREIEKIGRSYRAGGREVLPVLELITVVVHDSAGADGKYRSRIDRR